ncbi:MAG: hypothetical protein JWN69_809 [Alphaproteobacteria bacterium]|nr:hypothetical protein [Alphaproteobacteria bacterium]
MGVAEVEKSRPIRPNGAILRLSYLARAAIEEKRMAYDQARLKADRALASSPGALKAVIERLDR